MQFEKQPEKRFALPKEEQERVQLRRLQEAVYELQRQYPEVVSLNLFGSYTKGEATPESDIDGHLFVNAESFASDDVSIETSVHETHGQVAIPHTDATLQFQYADQRPVFSETQETYYNTRLQEVSHQAGVELPDEAFDDVFVTPISYELIDTCLDRAYTSIREVDAYRKNLAKEPGISDMREVQYPGMVYKPPYGYFSHLFHLAVGRGIKPYRQYLLSSLIQAGENGELIWARIAEELEAFEQNVDEKDDLPTDVSYPRTLAHAQKVYGG